MIPKLHIALLVGALCLSTVALAQDAGEPATAAAATELDPEEEEAALQQLQELDPERYVKAMNLRESNPKAYRAMLVKVAKHAERLDPEQYARRQRLREAKEELEALAQGYQDLSKKEQKTRRAEIETLCDEIFALRQAQRRHKIEAMTKKIEELGAEIDERDQRKDELIDEFVAELLGEKPRVEGL